MPESEPESPGVRPPPGASGTHRVDRREFLAGSLGGVAAAMLGSWPLEPLMDRRTDGPPQLAWDSGDVRHLLPTVSHSHILLKASFRRPLSASPRLRVESPGFGVASVDGRMNDTSGVFWQFYADGLAPGRPYNLSIRSSDGGSLCEPWPLSTFPAPDEEPERARILFYTCAGGIGGSYSGIGERTGFLPTQIRSRLLRRALSFQPDAVVANGDHIYWDLHTWQGENAGALSAAGERSDFDFSDPVFGTRNEDALKMAAEPQIVPVYGTDFRSTPVFFLQDDHDHWENDSPLTFPVPWFQLQLARATQQLYYPEFLPDPNRPRGLPWSTTTDRGDLSESFGTLRYGRLAEILLYDVRRTMTRGGPDALFLDRRVEEWLKTRTTSTDARHLVHAPSNPPGWTAGKWGEWYPDVLDPDTGSLSADLPKPHWEDGWLRQHDRIIRSLSDMPNRTPLVVSGDLHAIGHGRIEGSGSMDLTANPVNVVLSGPIGTSPRGFPSVVRGARPVPPRHLEVAEEVVPLEEHGFTLADFDLDRVVLRLFKWDVNSQPVEAIDELEPFHTVEL